MQIVFVLNVRVEAWLAAGGRVQVPRPLSCPTCGHEKVAFDGWYPRDIRRGRVVIQRLLCSNEDCGQRSHSLLPDVLVSRRVDLASVIGWALEAKASGVGHRPIAGQLGVPASTVRGWLRRAATVGGQVAGRLWAVAAAADPAVRAPPAGGGAVALVGAAGRTGRYREVWPSCSSYRRLPDGLSYRSSGPHPASQRTLLDGCERSLR